MWLPDSFLSVLCLRQPFHKRFPGVKEDMSREMGFQTAADVNEALEAALQEKGHNAHIAIIPDGVSVMVQKPKQE